MQGALPAPTGRSLGGNSPFARYGLYAGAVVAALVGLLVLPAVFHALGDQALQISDRVSVLDIIWLILGLALSAFLLGTRGAMLRQMFDAIRPRLEEIQHHQRESSAEEHEARSTRLDANLPAAGSTTGTSRQQSTAATPRRKSSVPS